ncbi:MAG TPA: hypothetical protein VFA68_09765 [Terriglobales bacterium]|nr:hypothetical protein [Terriglobales bacterium]
MSSRAGNWMIGVGIAGMLVGLSLVPAAMDGSDASLLALAGSTFSFSALLTASGIYFKARLIQANSTPEALPARKVKGGCDLCKGDVPIIQCRVHQLHLCANCLGQHYDQRSCAYTPSLRRAGGKAMTKAHGA